MGNYGQKFGRFEPQTRRDITAVLDPKTAYRAGIPWHSNRAVRFGNGPNYALFANLPEEGKLAGKSDRIDADGILTWTSGTMDKFDGKKGKELAAHDEKKNDVLLFARAGKTGPYYYFGRLGHPMRDGQSDRPFHMKWELLDAVPADADLSRIGLKVHEGRVTVSAKLPAKPAPSRPIAEPPQKPPERHTPPPLEERTVWEPQLSTEHELPPVKVPDLLKPAAHKDAEEKEEVQRILLRKAEPPPAPAKFPILVLRDSPWHGRLGDGIIPQRVVDEFVDGKLSLDIPPEERDRAVGAVAQYERGLLLKTGHPELANRVATETMAGFSLVHSFLPNGHTIGIMLKATTGSALSTFFLSLAELEYLQTTGESARIYRIYDWDRNAAAVDFFVIQPPFFAQGVLI